MPKSIVRYDLLISCPGDVQGEIDLIKECVEEFNEKFSDTLGVMVQVRHWGNSSYSQSGDKPQELLNEQFVKKCDAAVAVFWARFGTPTDRYGSGTEEEIDMMLNSGKQVFMYFAEKPISPSSLDVKQYEKIKEFKEKYKDKGIYFTYSSEEEFRKLFFSHLTKYFLSKKQMEENEKQNVPNLIVRGISENDTIEEIVKVRKFKTDQYINVPEKLEKIKQQYDVISKLEIEHTSAMMENQLLTNKKVEIHESVKQAVSLTAEQLSIELEEDFFDLGGLSENTFANLSILGRKNFVGGKNEKKKYELITSLSKQILELISWVPIANAFNGIKCLYLALENNGRYRFKYVDEMGKERCVYSWRLDHNDATPKGKHRTLSLREMEKKIQADHFEQIATNGGNMTVLELVEKYTSTKTGVRPTTVAGYGTVINLLKKDPFGKRRIDTVRISDAKCWLIHLQQVEKKSYSSIHSIRGVLRPAF